MPTHVKIKDTFHSIVNQIMSHFFHSKSKADYLLNYSNYFNISGSRLFHKVKY